MANPPLTKIAAAGMPRAAANFGPRPGAPAAGLEVWREPQILARRSQQLGPAPNLPARQVTRGSRGVRPDKGETALGLTVFTEKQEQLLAFGMAFAP